MSYLLAHRIPSIVFPRTLQLGSEGQRPVVEHDDFLYRNGLNLNKFLTTQNTAHASVHTLPTSSTERTRTYHAAKQSVQAHDFLRTSSHPC